MIRFMKYFEKLFNMIGIACYISNFKNYYFKLNFKLD